MTGTTRRPLQSPAWMEDAACTNQWELFFGPDDAAVQAWQLDEARKICGSCNVSSFCNQFAEGHDERTGIWAGVNREGKQRGNRSTVPRDGLPLPSNG